MAKAYRGVLKARINKLYGGDVTCSKVKKLKRRQDATKRDVQNIASKGGKGRRERGS